MEFHPNILSDPAAYSVGCCPAHSDHRFYRSEAELSREESSFRLDLNGLWQFHYASNPRQTVPGFEQPDFSCEHWDRIPVPAHIQLEGYDAPQYVNIQYPWEGHEEVPSGAVPVEFNPVASYVRTFTLPDAMRQERVFLVLEGAESAAAVWLNGHFLGYHEDSFTTAEWELTDFLCPGENKLAIQVFKWCTGSWFEDQDFFRFSGLFRDVYLLSCPAVHLWDLHLQALPAADLQSAVFTLDARGLGSGHVRVQLLDGGRTVFTRTVSFCRQLHLEASVEHPRLWSCEDPYLYTCRLEVTDDAGRMQELIAERVGFRRFEIRDSLMLLNGRRIVFRGVNRHEFNARHGRAIGKSEIEQDLRIIKQNNINAIRTSHYPNNSWLYRLCDEYGLYLIDETNLETHGTWDSTGQSDDRAHVLPGDDETWQPMLLQRADSLYERDKNHPSVLIWSCGNESFGGTVIQEMANHFRQLDPSRIVHYEGIFNDRRYPDTSDIESQMYPSAAAIRDFLRDHRDKPMICCEYSHAMGNSCGALHKYTELTEEEPLYQGGFIWDFADQALWKTDRSGRRFLAYGGDFDDRPSDYQFSGNGLVTADRVLTPKMQEVRFLYQPISVTVRPGEAEIFNRNLFTATLAWDCMVRVKRFGVLVEEYPLATDAAPLTRQRYALRPFPREPEGCYTVTVSFHLKEDTRWARAGHEIAFGQYAWQICGHASLPDPAAMTVVRSKHVLGVRGSRFEVLFSPQTGGLISYRMDGQELLGSMPKPNFWRAPTDNDCGNLMAARCAQWKIASLYLSTRKPAQPYPQNLPWSVRETGDGISVRFHYALPTTPEASCVLCYEVLSDGTVRTELSMDPVPGLSELPEFGVLFPLKPELDRVCWYGCGPADTYADRRHGARIGLFSSSVSGQMAPYLVPQECGNHEQVRFACVTDETGHGIRFESEAPGAFCFSALPWSPHELEQAMHVHELPPSHHTFVRVALAQMGVGGDDSWGARTHAEYCIPMDRPLCLRFSFRGI